MYTRRTNAARWLATDPRLLILDEPTKGFDPVNRRLLLDLVDEQRRAGATVVIITHQMDEVERLCDRILLIDDLEHAPEIGGGPVAVSMHDGLIGQGWVGADWA